MKKPPKINKGNQIQLGNFKRGKIVQFNKSMSEDEIFEIAAANGHSVWFYEPDTMEFKKFGKNICRLI